VITHLVRHFNGIEKYVQSLRSDRADYDEIPNRNTLQNVRLRINFQAFINISRKRICTAASNETRQAWQLILDSIKECEPELYNLCVPDCVYRGHCAEMFGCGYDKAIGFTNRIKRYRDYDGEEVRDGRTKV